MQRLLDSMMQSKVRKGLNVNSDDRVIRVRAGDGPWIECKSWEDAYQALIVAYEALPDWFLDTLAWSITFRGKSVSECMTGAMFDASCEDESAFPLYLQSFTDLFEEY